MIVFGLPFNGAHAGEGGFAEVALYSCGCEDGVGDALGDIHEEGVRVVSFSVAGSGDEINPTEGAVLHDFAPVRLVFAKVAT